MSDLEAAVAIPFPWNRPPQPVTYRCQLVRPVHAMQSDNSLSLL